MAHDILLLGDSHCHAILAGFESRMPHINTVGGSLKLEPGWPIGFHSASLPLHFTAEAAQEQLRGFFATLGQESKCLTDVNVPIALSITGIGQTPGLQAWRNYSPMNVEGLHFMSAALFRTVMRDYFRHLLSFYDFLMANGKTVVCIMPPGYQSNQFRVAELALKIKEILLPELLARGVKIADITAITCDEIGVLSPEFGSGNDNDIVHANPRWGALMAQEICAQLDLDASSIQSVAALQSVKAT